MKLQRNGKCNKKHDAGLNVYKLLGIPLIMKSASTFNFIGILIVATTSPAQQNKSAMRPELIAKYEKALAANPADDEAVESLHHLLAGLASINRAEKLRLKEVIRQHTRHAAG